MIRLDTRYLGVRVRTTAFHHRVTASQGDFDTFGAAASEAARAVVERETGSRPSLIPVPLLLIEPVVASLGEQRQLALFFQSPYVCVCVCSALISYTVLHVCYQTCDQPG